MKKQITFILILTLLTFSACGQKEIKLIDKANNRFEYRDRFEISLPKGYYFQNSVIYNIDSVKVGEVVFDFDKLISPDNLEEILKILNEGGQFETDDKGYWSDRFDCLLLKSGQIKVNSKEWAYSVDKTSYEGPGGFGLWNSFDFVNITDGDLILITFYNMDIEALEIDSYVKIVETIVKK